MLVQYRKCMLTTLLLIPIMSNGNKTKQMIPYSIRQEPFQQDSAKPYETDVAFKAITENYYNHTTVCRYLEACLDIPSLHRCVSLADHSVTPQQSHPLQFPTVNDIVQFIKCNETKYPKVCGSLLPCYILGFDLLISSDCLPPNVSDKLKQLRQPTLSCPQPRSATTGTKRKRIQEPPQKEPGQPPQKIPSHQTGMRYELRPRTLRNRFKNGS